MELRSCVGHLGYHRWRFRRPRGEVAAQSREPEDCPLRQGDWGPDWFSRILKLLYCVYIQITGVD